MHTKKILLAVLLSGLFAPAFAEDTTAPEAGGDKRVFMLHGPQGSEPGAMSVPLFRQSAKIIKNAPYTAEQISERQQSLPDGNEITNKTSAMSYRDSAGRTRHEVSDAKGEVRLVTIRDADGSTIMLHPKTKTLTKLPPRAEMVAAGQRARARIEQLRKEGKLPAAAGSEADGDKVIVKRVERMDGETRKQVEDKVRIRLAEGIAHADHARMAPLVTGAFTDMRWSSKASTRDLGTREIEGVKAEGKVRSFEIPAGEVGNRNPITVSDETWYSPELQITVYSKHSDPRSGERVYKLVGIKRDEPAAALFTVPPDYTVK